MEAACCGEGVDTALRVASGVDALTGANLGSTTACRSLKGAVLTGSVTSPFFGGGVGGSGPVTGVLAGLAARESKTGFLTLNGEALPLSTGLTGAEFPAAGIFGVSSAVSEAVESDSLALVFCRGIRGAVGIPSAPIGPRTEDLF